MSDSDPKEKSHLKPKEVENSTLEGTTEQAPGQRLGDVLYSWLNQANFTQTPKLFEMIWGHLIKWKAWVMGDMLWPGVSLYFSSLPSSFQQ